MKLHFNQLKRYVFTLALLLITSMAYAQLQVDIALPNGYKIDPYATISFEKYDNAESIEVYKKSFSCVDNSCGYNNRLDGFTLVVEHHTAQANIIGGGVWFNIDDAQNNYLTSCNLVAYTDDLTNSEVTLMPITQLFCYSPHSINGLSFPWSILKTATNDAFYNPHWQLYFGPASDGNNEFSTVIFRGSTTSLDVFDGITLYNGTGASNFLSQYSNNSKEFKQLYSGLNLNIHDDTTLEHSNEIEAQNIPAAIFKTIN